MKRKCKEWDSLLILCVNVKITIDTMLKFADEKVGTE